MARHTSLTMVEYSAAFDISCEPRPTAQRKGL
jgi:hypothetical protein